MINGYKRESSIDSINKEANCSLDDPFLDNIKIRVSEGTRLFRWSRHDEVHQEITVEMLEYRGLYSVAAGAPENGLSHFIYINSPRYTQPDKVPE